MNRRNLPSHEACAVTEIVKESFVDHMLHIILFILKIIGIVLLSVLGLLVLSIVCVLFVPVRYRIRVTRVEGEGQPPVTAYIKVTWLLHIINILVRYPAKLIVRVRVLIFTLLRIPEKEKKPKKPKKEKPQKPKKEKTKKEKKKEGEDKEAQSVQVIPEAKEKQPSTAVTEPYVAFMGNEEIETETDSEEPEEKKSLIAKIKKIIDIIKKIIEKIKEFFKNIQYTIRKFCDKIKAVLDNIQYYREVLESDPFRRSLQMCNGELGWILKRLKPDKFEADLIIGMEDPATTGEILAVFGMLYPLIGQHVRIAGDFECEKTRVEGNLYIRGRIRVFTFLRTAVRIYFNRDIKKLIKLLKKEAA